MPSLLPSSLGLHAVSTYTTLYPPSSPGIRLNNLGPNKMFREGNISRSFSGTSSSSCPFSSLLCPPYSVWYNTVLCCTGITSLLGTPLLSCILLLLLPHSLVTLIPQQQITIFIAVVQNSSRIHCWPSITHSCIVSSLLIGTGSQTFRSAKKERWLFLFWKQIVTLRL